MQFRVMMRGRGYIGAAGRGKIYTVSDDPQGQLTQPFYYFSQPQGILAKLFSRDAGIHRAFMTPSDYRDIKSLGIVLLDSKAQLQNFGMGNYALFRIPPGRE